LELLQKNKLNTIIEKLNNASNGRLKIKIDDDFYYNLKDFNRIIYESYLACKSDNPREELLNIRGPDGKQFINSEYVDKMIIDNDNYDFVDLENPQPYLSFKINSYDDIKNNNEILTNK
jgi:hypothetical protein